MSQSTRKKLLLAKIESSYGVDPTLAGANAMMVKNLTIVPLEAELVSREIIYPYFGNSQQLIANKAVKVECEVELVGPGVVGKIPAFDCLLRACAFARTAQTTSCTIAVSGGVATVTKSSHGYSVGDKVTISGCTDSDLNGEQTIASVPNANSFTYATVASDDATADGTPIITTGQKYLPVSSSIESVALDFNLDGNKHLVLGARGTVDVGLAVKGIPTFKFSFTGLYAAPTAAAQATPDYSGFMTPLVANTSNTPVFSLLSYSGALESMQLQMANDVQHHVLVGSDTVKIVDRKPSGTLVIESPALGTKDFFAAAVAQTAGILTLGQDSRNGYKVKVTCPNILLGNPSYQDSAGLNMLSLPFTANPSSGNDEVEILVA